MSQFDTNVAEFYKVRAAKFGYLERLSIEKSMDSSDIHLEMDLRSSTDPDSRRLSLAFEGVRALRVGDLSGHFFLLLEISSIAKSQLEGLKYEIHESEHNAFSFMCADFTVTVE